MEYTFKLLCRKVDANDRGSFDRVDERRQVCYCGCCEQCIANTNDRHIFKWQLVIFRLIIILVVAGIMFFQEADKIVTFLRLVLVEMLNKKRYPA